MQHAKRDKKYIYSGRKTLRKETTEVTRDWRDEDIPMDFRELGLLVQAGFDWLRVRFSVVCVCVCVFGGESLSRQ
jgi:hypothetical protein